MRTFSAFCVALLLGAGHGVVAASESDSGSARPEAKAFISRLDVESKIAQDATQASQGDAAALERLRATAATGDPYAQFRLGWLYRDGKGVPQSASEYVSWIQRSAAGGYARAQVALSGMYEKGNGVVRDLTLAFEWAQRAAEQGDAAGLGAVTMAYYNGRGVPRDYVQAVKWFTISLKLGAASDANGFLTALKQRAGPDGLASGEALAREWLDNYQKVK